MSKKMFLTSAGLPKETRDIFLKEFILPKDPKKMTVCFIPTAADPEEDKWFVDKSRNELKEIGFNVFDLDLKKESQESLKKKLSRANIIYVNGGNTFYLLDWMRKSGFDRVIKKQIFEGKIYIGTSAGAYITCPTIEVATFRGHDNNFFGMTDFKALNLVPFLVMAHFEERYREVLIEGAGKTKYPVIALNDRQAIVVKDDKWEIVGEGEEIAYGSSTEK